MNSSSLEVFKSRLDGAWSSLVWRRVGVKRALRSLQLKVFCGSMILYKAPGESRIAVLKLPLLLPCPKVRVFMLFVNLTGEDGIQVSIVNHH